MTALTPAEIVGRIRDDIRARGYGWNEPTVDRFIHGDPDREVTGVAVTWMATMAVLQAARDAGCSFVITHEPTFWNHLDLPPDAGSEDLYRRKRRWLDENEMTVWRFHDHHHAAFDRDPVMDAFFAHAGWSARTTGNSLAARTTLDGPPVEDVARHLAGRVPTQPNRVVGALDLVVGLAGLGGHDLAGSLPAAAEVDLIVAGEAREWDTFEYFRDAQALGVPRALIELSHHQLEDPASPSMRDWLQSLLPGVRTVAVGVPTPFEAVRV